MKKQLLMSGISRKHLMLLFGFFLIGTLSVSAQKYFELHDAYHNRSAIAGDNYDQQTYHQYANGRLNAQWKFDLVVDSFYTITDKKHGKLLGSGSGSNNNQIYHYDVTNADHVLWSLVDVDGRGVLFHLRNKKYNLFLVAQVDGGGDLYLWTITSADTKQAGSWRLIEKQGTGNMPKDVKGKEVKATSELVYNTNNNTTVSMYNLPRTLCGDVLGNQLIQGLPGSPPNDMTFMNSIPREKYGAMDQTRENAQSGKDYLISIYVNSPNRIDHTYNYVDLIDPTNNNWAGEKTRDSLKLVRRGDAYIVNYGWKGFYLGEYKLNTVSKDYHIPFGTASLLSRFFIQEQNISNGIPLNNTYLQIPFQVSGIVDHEVPILGFTTEPQVPYMVLHDPPGDASIASFSESKTICRDFENTYSTDDSFEAHAKVKIGVAGSAGLIVTTDFEFSVEFGIGATAGDLVVSTDANGTCIVTNEGFSTSSLDPDINDGSDVFIGYGYDLNYGKYRVIDFEQGACAAVENERLVYSLRGSGQDAYRRFVLTEGGIRNDIANLETKLNDPDQRTRANTKYQIDAWKKVLAANDSVKLNATELIGNPLIFNGGGQVADWSESITVTNSSSLTTEHYLAVTAGMETVLEIGGSGGSFGWNYNTEKRYGATAAQSGEESKVVAYSLSDNETGDFFRVNVLRDGRFGTPLFQLDAASKSSCPYEGGYQRDQPVLKIDGQSGDHITVGNVQGEIATIKLDLCNESNESRTYLVALGGQNPGGATVKMGGNTISANPYPITVDPNACAENYVLTVQRNPGVDAYPNLQIDMYPECDGNVSSSIFASVYFGTSAVLEQSPVTLLSVFPNPTSGELTADFSLEESADVQFELYDMVGSRIVIASKENYAAGQNRKQMNVEQVPSGIYQLAIKTNKSVISRKVIVQH
ncbi:MAG: T9SS type A sorting domain-containing protein [Saprospiraceae bacterium]|nr:T9SS type A sorting domain-containing protein [Candidatus Opimibacter iunctus]